MWNSGETSWWLANGLTLQNSMVEYICTFWQKAWTLSTFTQWAQKKSEVDILLILSAEDFTGNQIMAIGLGTKLHIYEWFSLRNTRTHMLASLVLGGSRWLHFHACICSGVSIMYMKNEAYKIKKCLAQEETKTALYLCSRASLLI